MHAHGRTVRHAGPKRRRHPSHITITRAPNIFFTLPRFLTEPLRTPATPRPPAASFDLSDNQRELFRGH
ncbi:hypothetical protein DWV00_14145 [Trinickia dinghuensis]|uniref:Uncharacterized protein n=2 Tax=Trinickia dinghuensis TaxID=2291023 RepID=A0A3D8K0J4_9BURK|nr:hypothetical protein DWV00_14145 [Trinickia dinghuensis]